MKKVTALIMSAVMMLCVFSGCNSKNGQDKVKTETTTKASRANTESLTAEIALKEEIVPKLEKLSEFYYEGSAIDRGADTKFSKNGIDYYPVKSEKIKTLQELKELTQSTYTEESALQIIEKAFDGKKLGNVYQFAPVFIEKDGQIYAAVETETENYNYFKSDLLDFSSIKTLSDTDSDGIVSLGVALKKDADATVSIDLKMENGIWKVSEYNCFDSYVAGIDTIIEANEGVVYLKNSDENADIKGLLAELLPIADKKQRESENRAEDGLVNNYYFLDFLKTESKSEGKITVSVPVSVCDTGVFYEPKDLTITIEKSDGNWAVTSRLY